MLFLTIAFALLFIIMSVLVVKLFKVIQHNQRIFVRATTSLLQEQEVEHEEALQDAKRRYLLVLGENQKQTKLIQDLEQSIEVLNTEINRLEEINGLEQKFKDA